MYYNIDIIVATKHNKEIAIKNSCKLAFSANIYVPNNYDTDQFGTFTGEIPRDGTPYETVVNKARHAMTKYVFDYAIASEGSFGQHPAIFFAAADHELLCFIDNKLNITVVESVVTTNTNFSYLDFVKTDDYHSFLRKVQFPSHGVILRNLEDNSVIRKGIIQAKGLDDLISESFKKYKTLRFETDMRAMFNPSRMKVIEGLAEQLVKRLLKCCPQCNSPGFGQPNVTGSLPCKLCGNITELYAHKLLKCVKCDYHELLPRADGMVIADPKYCHVCNP